MFDRTRVAGFAVVSLAIAMLAGCSSSSPPQSSSSSSKPVTGGTLTYLEEGAATDLYPPHSGSYTSGGIVNNVLDRLTWQDQTTLKIEPWIATSWDVNSSDTEYTFHLRKGVTFSDGERLDAAAVKKNFDTYGLGNPALGLSKSETINNYKRSVVVDPQTIKFFFNAPAPGFLQATSTINSGLLAPKSLDQNFNKFSLATNIIGSGPFTVASQTVNEKTELVARKDYDWAPPSAPHQGRAYLDGIKYIIKPENSVRIGALVSGQADFVRGVPAQAEKQVTSAGDVLYAPQTKGVNDAVNFRPTNPLVSDVRVRQAIVHGVNIKAIHKSLFTSNYPIATSILSDLAEGYVDTSSYLAHDPSLSDKLLDEAGWTTGPGGIRQKAGKKLILNAYYQPSGGQPQTKQTFELMQQQLKAIGVGLNILSPTSAGYATKLLDPATTPLYIGDAGRADMDVIGTYFGCKNRDVLRYCDPGLETLLAAAHSQPDSAERAKDVQAAQVYIAKQALAIPILQEPQVFGGSTHVKGVAFESVGRPWFYGTWIAGH